MTATYVTPEVSSLEDFWRTVGEAVDGAGGYRRRAACGVRRAAEPDPKGHIHYHSPTIATKHAKGEIPPQEMTHVDK